MEPTVLARTGRGGTAPLEVTRARAWVLATRPKTLPLSVAPILLGAAVAHAAGGVNAPLTALALATAVLLQVAANLANDAHDAERGADTPRRKGPLRVTQAGLLPAHSVKTAALACLAAAAAAGAYLLTVGGWPLALLGAAAIASAWAYTGGPWPLGYHGLGEILVFAFFGPVAVAGTAYLNTGAWSADALVASITPGALAAAVLVANNHRDRDEDAAAGKRTLAVRLGPTATVAGFGALLVVGLAAPLALLPRHGWAALALLALPLALRAWHEVQRDTQLNTALARTVQLATAATALLALGVAL